MKSSNPDPADLFGKGLEWLKRDRFPEAQAAFGDVLRRQPNHPGAIHYLGVTLMRLDRFDEAVALIRRSIRLRPGVADYHHNLGAALRALGEFDEAEQAYRKAIELRPDYAEAWFNYSGVKRFRDESGAAALATIEAQLATGTLSDLDREFLHFAAGKIADDRGEFDLAFSHYQEGNRLRGHVFDREDFLRMIDRLEQTFTNETLLSLGAKRVGCDSEEPVFIVGMPRSGTTLVEQILASHPSIVAAGELPDIRAIAGTISQYAGGASYPENVLALPEAALEGFASHYLKLRDPIREPGTRRIVDKMPSNFLHVGLIRLLFPNSRIIHLVRDPRDTCLSCWFQRFRSGHEYASDLADLGFYYRVQERMMRHWKSVISRGIHTLHYESLVESPEAVVREMLEFCGVTWDDACLRFHQTERAVTTASNLQVRQPLNRRGLDRWKNYETHLAPLFESLAAHAGQ
ncbi:MAG: sulfotransferase [Verrucomicrobiae bacterium]|nr:sulfotransferase [Verrucomicrobiae bacterium]